MSARSGNVIFQHTEVIHMFKAPTICAVRRNGVTAMAGDGQVTMGESVIMKGTAKKVRRIYGGKVVTGFAGSVADAFALSEKFEEKLTQFSGNLPRSAVELAQITFCWFPARARSSSPTAACWPSVPAAITPWRRPGR